MKKQASITFASTVALFVGASSSAQVVLDGVTFTDRGALVGDGSVAFGSLRGGPGVLDFNNDGFMDLVIADEQGQLQRLFENAPDPTGTYPRTFIDVTAGSGLDDQLGRDSTGRAAVTADYDNDGDTDIFIIGRKRSVDEVGLLYRNEGNGTFTNVSYTSGVRNTDGDNTDSCGWIDFDLDGNIDLLITSRIPSPNLLRLMRNNGDGTFTDVSDVLPDVGSWGTAYSQVWTDYDADGYPDCFLPATNGPTVLHNISDGAGGRQFENTAGDLGFNTIGPAPMGINIADFDGDLDSDISIANGNVGVFFEVEAGTLTRVTPLDAIWAWGVFWFDVDNDGDRDHYQAGSVGQQSGTSSHNVLFRNMGGGQYDNVSGALNDLFVPSQHAVRIDIDNDGRLDIVTINPFGDDPFVSLMQNGTATTNHWVSVHARAVGTDINADAIGAQITVVADGVSQYSEVTSGSSVTSSEDPRQHFGLGSATTVDRIEVVWPRRAGFEFRRDIFEGPFAADQVIMVQPKCRVDLDEDGSATISDLLAFLAAWFGGDADFGGDDGTSIEDLLAFLSIWFDASTGGSCF